MSFNLSIATDNNAFADNPTPELARILRTLADRLEYGSEETFDSVAVRDVNGNTVGTWTLEDDIGLWRTTSD